MQKNPIGWVEIPVLDLDRAEKFYTAFFGWEMNRQPEKDGFTMSWFPMEMDSYGSGATLVHGPMYKPVGSDGVLVYFTAPEGSVAKALKKAEEQGIEVILPRKDIGEYGFMAIIKDSEGNHIALHSRED